MYNNGLARGQPYQRAAGRGTVQNGGNRSQSNTRITGQSNQDSPKRNNSVGRPNRPTAAVVSPTARLFGLGIQEIPAPYLDPQPSHLLGRKTLVLDLDETLVHSAMYPVNKPDFVIKSDYGNQRFYVLKRPFLDEFLARVNELFEVCVFTCGDKEYATKVIKRIDPAGVISKILHREFCCVRRGLYTKDIGKLGRDMKDVIFVDNWEVSFMLHPDNGYKILDFINNKKDVELKKLIPFLEHLNGLDDVRPIAKKYTDYLAELREQKLTQKDEEESQILFMNPPILNESPAPNNKSMNSEFKNGYSTPTKMVNQSSLGMKPYMTQEKKSGKGAIQIQKTPIGTKKSPGTYANQSVIFSSKKFETKGENQQESGRVTDQIQESNNIFQPTNQIKAEFLSRVYGKPISQDVTTEKIAAL